MWLTEWLADFRGTLRLAKELTGVRYFVAVTPRIVWADARIRMGRSVAFSQDAVRAAGQFDAGTEFASRFNACRRGGDRAGMRLWRDASVYAVVSAMHGEGKIRVVGS